jgi:hypothetical protein
MQTLPLVFSLTGLLFGSNAVGAETAAGRISQVTGQVELRNHGKTVSNLAQIDGVVAAHSVLTTRARGRAELLIDGNRIRLDAESELEIAELSARRLILKLHYGSIFLDSPNVASAQRLELLTGSGRVQVSEAGQVRIDSSGPEATAVRLFSGNVSFVANGSQIGVASGSQMVWRGGQISSSAIGPDEFDDWCLGRAAPSRAVAGASQVAYPQAESYPRPVSNSANNGNSGNSGYSQTTQETVYITEPVRETVYVNQPSYIVEPYPVTRTVTYPSAYPYWGYTALDVGLWLTLGHYWYRGGYGYHGPYGHYTHGPYSPRRTIHEGPTPHPYPGRGGRR